MPYLLLLHEGTGDWIRLVVIVGAVVVDWVCVGVFVEIVVPLVGGGSVTIKSCLLERLKISTRLQLP